MVKRRRSGSAALLGAAFLLYGSHAGVAGPYTGGAGPLVDGNIVVTVDENGHGTVNGLNGLQPAPFTLQNDPGPGGLANTLTYSLLNPPGLTAGDILINEPGDGFGDVVRFNPNEVCSGGTGCLVFYSATPPFDSLADTATPPGAFYANTVTLTENAAGQVIYTPVAGQPGFVAGASVPVVYDLISDVTVPAPLIGHGLPGVLAVGGVLLFGVTLFERNGKRRSRGTAVPQGA